ncbi:MAG: hypothetical protein IJK84_10205 [Bacteroidales bacterium]|nr:hypothetical protein [Bacteroidales bacterium]
MKKTLLFALLLLAVCTAAAQSENREERFLNRYEAFVNEVVATPVADFHGDTLNHYRKMQRRFMRRYRWCYDTRLSIEQLEQFNKLCGRYHRKMSMVNNRRRWAATKGRIEGRFEALFHRHDVPIDTLQIDTLVIIE